MHAQGSVLALAFEGTIDHSLRICRNLLCFFVYVLKRGAAWVCLPVFLLKSQIEASRLTQKRC